MRTAHAQSSNVIDLERILDGSTPAVDPAASLIG
jgi:hypothetical protein